MADQANGRRMSTKVPSGTGITAQSIKLGAEGVAKGTVEAADTATQFHYAPTLIALFPVFASFFFGSHTEHWTDLILLGLVAVYLHNCVTVPWAYYKASRRRYKTAQQDLLTDRQQTASRQLRHAELQAFGGLMIGPLLGALLLNYVRDTMARPANGLITNFNITVFVLAAEMRPLKIAFGYLNGRSEALQEELLDAPSPRYDELATKIQKLESRLAQQGTQEQQQQQQGAPREEETHPDVTQIAYALRKFQKHEAHAKDMLAEKLYAMERKLADLAARNEPLRARPRSLARGMESLLLAPIRIAWTLVTMPVHLAQRLLRP